MGLAAEERDKTAALIAGYEQAYEMPPEGAPLDVGLDLRTNQAGRLHTTLAGEEYQARKIGRTITHLISLMEETVPLRVVPQLERLDARWHPSGFMVFSLGDAPDGLGTCRLHIWPQGWRQRESRGLGEMDDSECGWDGDIHNHAWHVTSYCIDGYQDKIIDIRKEGDPRVPDLAVKATGLAFTAQEVVARGLFYRFRPWYLSDGRDALVNTGHCVSITTKEHRRIAPASLHRIDPWVYHVPTIPDDQFAATLVVNSQTVAEPGFPWDEEFDGDEPWNLPDILIRGATESIAGTRRVATLGEKLLAKTQLAEVLSKPPYDFTPALKWQHSVYGSLY